MKHVLPRFISPLGPFLSLFGRGLDTGRPPYGRVGPMRCAGRWGFGITRRRFTSGASAFKSVLFGGPRLFFFGIPFVVFGAALLLLFASAIDCIRFKYSVWPGFEVEVFGAVGRFFSWCIFSRFTVEEREFRIVECVLRDNFASIVLNCPLLAPFTLVLLLRIGLAEDWPSTGTSRSSRIFRPSDNLTNWL